MVRVAGIVAMARAIGCFWAGAEDDDHIMGNYQGAFTGKTWQDRTIRAQVAATSLVRYRAVFYVGAAGGSEKGGEIKGKKIGPAANDDKKERWEDKIVEVQGEGDRGSALGGRCTITGKIQKEVFAGVIKGKTPEGAFELKRVFIEPPTLGVKAPEGAIVLLDGTNLDQWAPCPHWRLQEDGSLQVQGSDIVTTQQFGDAQYHLEFRCPFLPVESGQARGNSGVYVQGRYEIQVLDSFADLPADNLCGGIYKEAVPLVCASLPPLQWQTYDITFRAPKFDAAGHKTANARITVVHNGITIHDDLELKNRTPGGLGGDEASTGPLLLQDHGNPVRFRNVWVKPLN